MKKMLRVVVAGAFALALGAGLVGCGGSGSDLKEGVPSWGDEDTLAQEVQAIIEDFSARDYDAVAQKGEIIKLTADQLAQAGDTVLDALGTLVDFGDVAFAYAKDSSGDEYAVIVQIANYENGAAQYTISLYEDGSMCGFYVK